MASRTRTAPTRVQLRPTPTTNTTNTEMDGDGNVKCTGHGRRCSRLVAGQGTKNPGRAFYTCPLARNDPNKCKFFKWEDELQSTTPQKQLQGGQRLGQTPQANRIQTATTTPTRSVMPPRAGSASEIVDEIDWDKVDTDELEHQAILSTPGSSQKASTSQDTPTRERLRAAVEEGVGKRKRDDDELTPKRAKIDTENPFLNTTPQTPRTPSHPVLSPALASLEQVSEHIQRQERLIRAGEQMKQGLRKTISSLQDKNEALEARVKELEAQLAAR